MRFPQPSVFVTEGMEAAALWLPPGEAELDAADEARTPAVLAELLGDRGGEVLELLERFDAAQPEDPPHYYLSLLGVHDDHRGKGIGMGLPPRTSHASMPRASRAISNRATLPTTTATRSSATAGSAISPPPATP